MYAQAEIGRDLGELRSLAPAGYAIALHIRFTTPTFLFQTYPKAWIDVYSEKGLVMQDPTVLWGFENDGMVDWSDLPAESDPAGVMKQAAEYGMRHGFTYAVQASGNRTIASFTRTDAEFTDADKEAIREITDRIELATRDIDQLSTDLREALRRMSIAYTHPGKES